MDLSATRAKPVRTQGTNCSWERTGCCQEAAAALPTALTSLCTCTNQSLGTFPGASALRVSSLSSNKALFLGELQKNLDFATAIMSSQVTWYFHSFSADEIIIQMMSQSSSIFWNILAVLQMDQAPPKAL